MQPHILARTEAAWNKKLNALRIDEAELDVQEIERGIVLPVRHHGQAADQDEMFEGLFEGGVVTGRYAFVAGSLRNSAKPKTNYSCCFAYRPKIPPVQRDETVVFGGIMYGHYGHTLIDGMSRMWWFVRNQDTPYKLVFVVMPGESSEQACKLLSLAGLTPERYEVITSPTQFSKVIVPDEAIHSLEGYVNVAWPSFFDLVARRCSELSTIETHEKLYLTRTALERCDGVGEEYYERFFASQGYRIVSPEQLPLQDQIKLYAGADSIACTMGTLSHAAVFAREGAELACLLRCGTSVMPQLIVNQVKRLDWTMFDAFLNVLPTEQGYGAYLYAPTKYFRSYLGLKGIDYRCTEDDEEQALRDNLYDYLQLWYSTYSDKRLFRAIKKKTIFDVLNSLSISLHGVSLSRADYEPKPKGLGGLIKRGVDKVL